MHHRTAGLAGIVLLSTLLLGCSFSWLTIDENRKNPPPAEQKSSSVAPSGSAEQTAAPQQPTSETPSPEIGIAGTWNGTLAFTSYKMLIKDKRAAELFADDIEETLEEPYPIKIKIDSDDPGGSPARMTFDGKLLLKGTATRRGTTVKMVFKRKGDKSFEVGASPPVAFTLTGTIGAGPAMRGKVLYEVFQANGGRAWTENGNWDAARSD